MAFMLENLYPFEIIKVFEIIYGFYDWVVNTRVFPTCDMWKRKLLSSSRANFESGRNIEASDFDGRLDPKVFLDWVSNMDRYFEWHNMLEVRRVRFAKWKLVGQALIF